MKQIDETIMEQAIAWHLASLGDAMDWDGFTNWLEADPRHRAAFDQVALTDALVDEHRTGLEPALGANDGWSASEAAEAPQRRFGAARWLGGGIAAALVAVVAVWQFGGSQGEVYETLGQPRSIALEDGSRIELAPHSRIEIDGSHDERIALDGGAWFDIRHDPSRSLSVDAGGLTISDIGTRFDIQAAAGQVRVQVAQGRVRVSSGALAAPIELARGHGLTYDPAGGTAAVETLEPAKVGAWREGRLSFDAAPLALVAADLNRYAQVEVTVADDLRDRRFTGTLVIGDGKAALRDLSQLMDLELGRSGDGYRLESRKR